MQVLAWMMLLLPVVACKFGLQEQTAKEKINITGKANEKSNLWVFPSAGLYHFSTILRARYLDSFKVSDFFQEMEGHPDTEAFVEVQYDGDKTTIFRIKTRGDKNNRCDSHQNTKYEVDGPKRFYTAVWTNAQKQKIEAELRFEATAPANLHNHPTLYLYVYPEGMEVKDSDGDMEAGMLQGVNTRVLYANEARQIQDKYFRKNANCEL